MRECALPPFHFLLAVSDRVLIVNDRSGEDSLGTESQYFVLVAIIDYPHSDEKFHQRVQRGGDVGQRRVTPKAMEELLLSEDSFPHQDLNQAAEVDHNNTSGGGNWLSRLAR